MNNQYILVVGNVINGLEFVGPFIDWCDAREWAKGNILGIDWSIAELETPKLEVEDGE